METAESLKLKPQDMQWWRDAKFGMFIHWGLYSLLGKGEWVMFNERMDVDEYAKLATRFDAKDYDPEVWAATARAAGMKYMVMTTRHHDGFSLFDSKASDFNSVKSAAKRDLIAEYVAACRKAGLKVGFYYSPLDWRFPGFFFHTMYRANAQALKSQTYEQVRELMTNYGQIDILWYDGGEDDWLGLGGLEWGYGNGKNGWYTREASRKFQGPSFWEPEKLNAMVRELQPKIVINPRSGWQGDFDCREHADGDMDNDRPWERCTTLAGAWGWTPNARMRPLRELVRLIAQIAGRGGNLLLNVGPTAAGVIEDRQVMRLSELGQWLDEFGESIYGTRGGPFAPGEWGVSTCTADRIYLHLLEWPDDTLVLPNIPQEIVSSHSLNALESSVEQRHDSIRVRVHPDDRIAHDTIVVLELTGTKAKPKRKKDEPTPLDDDCD